MKLSYLRGFPNEIKIINKALNNATANLKRSQVPLTPDNIANLFNLQKQSNNELAIAVENYEGRLGLDEKSEEMLKVKRMARETILSLFHLLQLDNMEDLESILREIDDAREVITIISLFGTASFFIAEFSKSSQLKDSSQDAKKMTTDVSRMMDDNKEKLRNGIKIKDIKEEAGQEILSSLAKSQATIEDHSMRMENLVRAKDQQLAKLLAKIEKTERMFDQMKKHHIEMVKKIDRIALETRTDPLTGMLNWKGFMESLEREVSRRRRYKTPLSIALIHIDNLIDISEEYGTPVRDKLLAEVGRHVADITRKGDVTGRIGGETLAVFFTNTDLEASLRAVKKLQANVEDTDFTVRGNPLRVFLSIGVNLCGDDCTADGLMESVNSLLQRAKEKEGHYVCAPDDKE